MVVVTFNEEFACAIAPHRMYHAWFVDAHNSMPKIMPQVVKSIDFLSGDGSPGSVKQVNFADGSPVKYVKNRLDLKDPDNFICNYTAIECPAFGDKIDYVSNEVKFEATLGGGCVCKVKIIYHPKGDALLNEEELMDAKEKYMDKFKAVQNYLVENPQVYA